MRKYWKLMAVTLCLALTATVVNVDTAKEFCFPENNLNISVNAKALSMSEATFNRVIDVVEDQYRDVIKDLGGELQVERKWKDGTVNAYAQRVGNVYKVSMFGGLARHAAVTPDGFAMVVCHEIGHHIGGYPKKKSWWGTAWASNEGQADYWGATKCMKKVVKVLEVTQDLEEQSDYQFALKKCERNFDGQEDQMACARSAMAGKSLAELFRALRKLPKELHFWTRDKKVVTTINHSHPAPQCRMDTYFAGALCDKEIDAKISDTDETLGFCTVDAAYAIQERPECWFKPLK